MKIDVLQTCMHGRDRFTAGDTTTVSDEVAEYLIAQGWAVRQGENPPQGKEFKESIMLSIDNGRIGTSDTMR